MCCSSSEKLFAWCIDSLLEDIRFFHKGILGRNSKGKIQNSKRGSGRWGRR
jgi:hypothetical protein